jgi:hypothetical protein
MATKITVLIQISGGALRTPGPNTSPGGGTGARNVPNLLEIPLKITGVHNEDQRAFEAP